MKDELGNFSSCRSRIVISCLPGLKFFEMLNQIYQRNIPFYISSLQRLFFLFYLLYKLAFSIVSYTLMWNDSDWRYTLFTTVRQKKTTWIDNEVRHDLNPPPSYCAWFSSFWTLLRSSRVSGNTKLKPGRMPNEQWRWKALSSLKIHVKVHFIHWLLGSKVYL